MPKTRTRNVEKTCFTVVVTRCTATPPHTATGKAAVAVPGHSQAFILGTKFDARFGNFFWSQLCAMIFTISSPAGRSFLAGGLHFVTIFVPSFGHRFWSQFWAPGCPQIQGLLMNLVFVTQFWAPDLVPKTGPQNLTIFCPGIRIRFNQILKKI